MAGEVETSTTVGVTGQSWRALVSPWGAVTPWRNQGSGNDSEQTLDWFIAADDRWHRPAAEAAVRQRRIDGAPVTETRVRIPDGDAVQRVWSVADAGGLTIVEIENDSPLPVAVAFTGIEVLTGRSPADVPIRGIELPDDTITLPIGHRSSIRVAIAHDVASHDRRSRDSASIGAHLPMLPGADAVVRGWVAIAERASRLQLPDDALAEAVVAARCDVILNGPVDASADPVGFVLDVGELVRTGDAADAWLPEIVGPLEEAARSGDEMLLAALIAGQRIASAAGDRRAVGDIERLRARMAQRSAAAPLGPFSELRRGESVGRFVHDVERRLADGGALLPAGIPTRWLGANFELHGVPTSAESSVSFAIRWHGARAAVLWEQSGVAQRLTAPAVDAAWSSAEMSGEGLLTPAQQPAQRAGLAVTSAPADPQGDSTIFS